MPEFAETQTTEHTAAFEGNIRRQGTCASQVLSTSHKVIRRGTSAVRSGRRTSIREEGRRPVDN